MENVKPFGNAPDGTPVHVYVLSLAGVTARVMDFGVTLLGVDAPDRDGNVADLVLGYDRLEGYFADPAFYGCSVGPSANRVENAELTIAGTVYHLPKNDGPENRNNNHTDFDRALHKCVWEAAPAEDGTACTFTYHAVDGEWGLPGNRTFTARYSLSLAQKGGVALTLEYGCETDAETYVNMTAHTYWNLAGHASGKALSQVACIYADHYLPLRDDNVSLGEVAEVAGTPFDFRRPKALGANIAEENAQLAQGRGYDHCFCVDNYEPDDDPRPAFHAEDPASGRTLDISINTPGAHLYTGNWLDDRCAKDGATYTPNCGFAFEPEYWPNNNRHADWVHPVCTPEHPYAQRIIYRLSVTEE